MFTTPNIMQKFSPIILKKKKKKKNQSRELFQTSFNSLPKITPIFASTISKVHSPHVFLYFAATTDLQKQSLSSPNSHNYFLSKVWLKGVDFLTPKPKISTSPSPQKVPLNLLLSISHMSRYSEPKRKCVGRLKSVLLSSVIQPPFDKFFFFFFFISSQASPSFLKLSFTLK